MKAARFIVRRVDPVRPEWDDVGHPQQWVWILCARNGMELARSRPYRTRAYARYALAEVLRLYVPEAAQEPLITEGD